MPRLLTSVLTIAGGIVTLAALWNLGIQAYRRTFGKRRFARQKLFRLETNTNLSYFSSILGPPALTIKHSEKCTKHIFIDKFYYVQAIVKEETVKIYTVTVRDKKLRCIVPLPGKGRYTKGASSVKIQIGRATFGSFPEPPQSVIGFKGARRAFYIETYYFGNPMNYQTLILSYNDAGFGSWPPVEELLKDFGYRVDSSKIDEYLESDSDLRLRGGIHFNSYGFTAPHQIVPDDTDLLGVDGDQVRVIP